MPHKPGTESVMVWVPAGLHRAWKTKLAQDGLTAREALIYLITRYTGYKETANVEPQPSGQDKTA